jgi:hypothetical protein
MYTRILIALTTLLVSTHASAWNVPIHLCDFPSTPTPAGTPIPCSYTNEDDQTFNGVVTSSSGGGVLCSGMVAPTPQDPTEAADVKKLLMSLGEDPKDLPVCGIHSTTKGALLECPLGGEEPGQWGMVKVCDNDGCAELDAYADCAAYWEAVPATDGVTCDDLA